MAIKVSENDDGDGISLELDEEDFAQLSGTIKGHLCLLTAALEKLVEEFDKTPMEIKVKLGVWCSGGLLQLDDLLHSGEFCVSCQTDNKERN